MNFCDQFFHTVNMISFMAACTAIMPFTLGLSINFRHLIIVSAIRFLILSAANDLGNLQKNLVEFSLSFFPPIFIFSFLPSFNKHDLFIHSYNIYIYFYTNPSTCEDRTGFTGRQHLISIRRCSVLIL
jgi:hypothetical protein